MNGGGAVLGRTVRTDGCSTLNAGRSEQLENADIGGNVSKKSGK